MGKILLKVHQHVQEESDTRTTVTYELSSLAEVQIKLYDNLGTLLMFQMEGERSEGIHTFVIDTEGLADGRYYYLIEAGDASAIRSLTVIRGALEQADFGTPALDQIDKPLQALGAHNQPK